MALGKNLGNILGDYFGEESVSLQDAETKEDRILELQIDQIQLGPYQTRRQFDSERIDTLARSIKEAGLLSPIIVLRRQGLTENGETEEIFVLLAGERRLRAFKSLGRQKIPAMIRQEEELPPKEQALITAYENIQREDLSPIELGQTFYMLMQTQGLDETQLAEKLGYSTQHIKNYLRLLTLSEPVQRALLDRKLTEGQARYLVSLNEQEQLEMLQLILEKNLTVKEIIKILKQQKVSADKKPKSVRVHSLSQDIVNKAERLAEYFEKSKVKVQGDSEKGKIIISWG